MKSLPFFLLLFSPFNLFAGSSAPKSEKIIPLISFLENKGQIHDQNGGPGSDILYLHTSYGLKVHLKRNSFSYEVFHVADERQNEAKTDSLTFPLNHSLLQKGLVSNYSSHRVDIELLGAQIAPEVIAEGESEDVENYFINGLRITGVHHYNKVTYKDIYPSIDLVFYSQDVNGQQQVKYDFILKPGGKVSDIQLKYRGASSLKVRNEKLIIGTSLGNIEEAIPVCYTSNDKSKVIKCQFKLKNSVIAFSTPQDSYTDDLVIDPTIARVWGTYYGGVSWDFGYALKIDGNDNLYLAGTSSYLSANVLATSGAYQTTITGQKWDCFISKFNSNGQRIWGTYYGSSDDNDAIDFIELDSQGYIIALGNTKSPTGIATAGAHQTGYGGGSYNGDAFVAKFTSNGFLTWSTYYGGSGAEYREKLIVDNADNIIICGYTTSNCVDTIASAGSHQSVYGGGTEDGFIAKFNPNGTRLWGTYYGGTGQDKIFDCYPDVYGNIFMGGYTNSSSSISTPGTYQPSLSGPFDGFVGKFSPSGARKWCSYFGGSNSDYVYGVLLDNQNKLVLVGNTSSPTGIATAGTHQPVMNGLGDLFVVKFDSSFTTRSWGTYLGGTASELPYDAFADSQDNIIITGYATGATGFVNPGAHQDYYGGNYRDGFTAKMSSAGQRVWCTLYGGSGDDESIQSVVDSQGDIYSYGWTYSSNNIATPGSYQPNFAGSADAFLVKFEELRIILTPFTGPICAGSTLPVSFTTQGYFGPTNTFQAELSSGTGSWTSPTVIGSISGVTSGTITATIPPATLGNTNYRIRIKSIDRGVADTDNGSNIIIHPLPAVTLQLPFNFCVDAPAIPFTGISPGGQPAGGTFSGPGVNGSGVFDPSAVGTGTYSICYNYTDAYNCTTQVACQNIFVIPPPVASFSPIPPACINTPSFALTQGSATGPGVGVYTGPGVNANEFNPAAVGTGTFTLAYIYNDLAGCTDTAYQTVTVYPAAATPTVSYNGSVLTSTPAQSYQWYFNGNPIAGATGQTHFPQQLGNYYVVVTDQIGCSVQSAPYNVLVLGLNEIGDIQILEVSPNPFLDYTVIYFSQPLYKAKLLLYNTLGVKTVLEEEINGNKITIRKENLPAGIYLFRVIFCQREVVTGKVVIQ